jgi:flagellar protein FlaJ
MLASFRGYATSMFGWVVDKYPNLFIVVRDNLPRADIRVAYRTYMSMVFFLTSFIYIISLLATIVALSIIPLSIVMRVVFILFVPLVNSVVAFVVFSFYPIQKSTSRKKNIETNLPFVLTHIGAIAESGVPPYVVFRLIGQFKEYGEISTEMRKITKNIEDFGIDPLSAIREIAERSPSETFKQVLLGYISATEAGGNVKLYLKEVGEKTLFDWRIKREKFLQQLSTYAEFYTGLLIAAPLFIISLFSVMGMIQPTISGYNILDLMKMSIYLVVPILNGAFLLFLKGIEVEI